MNGYSLLSMQKCFNSYCPDKTFGLKLIPKQSHLFRFIPKSVGQSELIRVNSRFFNPNQNSVQDFQSD